MVADASSLGVRPGKGDLAPARPRVQSYRFIRAYWTTFQVIFRYLSLGLGAASSASGWYGDSIGRAHRRNARRVERDDPRAPGPLHQGRPAPQHHGELPPEAVPHRARGPAGPGAAAPFEEIDAAHRGGARRPVDRALRPLRARADRQRLARPGARGVARGRHARRGEGAAPATSTRSCGSISRPSAASWRSCSCSSRCRGSTPTTTRSAR